MSRRKLADHEIKVRLGAFPNWQWKQGDEALFCQLEFSDFKAAFAFMTAAALVSEKLDHHPSWSNTYNRLSITLFTHDAKGISELDFLWIEGITQYLPTSSNFT